MQRPDVVGVAGLIKRAWQHREQHLEHQNQPVVTPTCMQSIEETLGNMPSAFAGIDQLPELNMDNSAALNFDMIDWSLWDTELFQTGEAGFG